MSIVSQIIFTLLSLAVFSFFGFQVLKRWKSFKKTGQGIEEDRSNNPGERLLNIAKLGLAQVKMFKDKQAGIMHFVIFWGLTMTTMTAAFREQRQSDTASL